MKNKKSVLLDTFFLAVRRLRQLDRLNKEGEGEGFITILQTQVLTYLKHHDGATITDLSVYMQMSLSSTTQLVERLINANWVIREHDSKDKRVVHITLSNKGEQKLQELQVLQEKRYDILATDMTENELETLARLMTQMADGVDKRLKKQI